RCWRIKEDSVTRSAQSTAASRRVHIVPAADSIPRRPTIGPIVKKTCRTLGEVEEAGLNAFVDWRIIHHPFRSVAVTRVAARVAPEVASAGKRQRGPLLHGVEKHPVIHSAVQIGVHRVESYHRLDAAV